MTYGIRRKYNIKAWVPEHPQYEMVEFAVEECESREEAEEALKAWVGDYFAKLKEQSKKEETPEDKFFKGIE